MWAFPYLSWFTLAMLVAFIILMLSDSDARAQLTATAVLFVIITVIGIVWRRFHPADSENLPTS